MRHGPHFAGLLNEASRTLVPDWNLGYINTSSTKVESASDMRVRLSPVGCLRVYTRHLGTFAEDKEITGVEVLLLRP